jgi:hypothetical protein
MRGVFGSIFDRARAPPLEQDEYQLLADPGRRALPQPRSRIV